MANKETESKAENNAEKKPSAHEVFGTEESYANSGIDVSDNNKDLTETVTGLWPGNPSQRQGSFYITLNRLELEKDQVGLIGNFPEGFVFERADVHCLSVTDTELELSLYIGRDAPTMFLGTFCIHAESQHVSIMETSETDPGQHVAGKNIYLQAMSEIPANGRLLIAVTGYQIETWR